MIKREGKLINRQEEAMPKKVFGVKSETLQQLCRLLRIYVKVTTKQYIFDGKMSSRSLYSDHFRLSLNHLPILTI